MDPTLAEKTTHSSKRSLLARIFLSPDEKRLRAGWRILGHFLIILILYLLLAVGMGFFVVLNPSSSLDTQLFLGQLASFLAVTFSVYIARGYLDQRPFSALGLHWNRQAIRDLLMGVGIAGMMMAAVFVSLWGAGYLSIEQFAWQELALPAVLTALGTLLITFILVGWQEELLVRGYWMQNIAEGLNVSWAVFLTSVLFGLLHMLNPNATWFGGIGTALAGIIMAYAYLATRRLWLPIGLHIGWNFFEGPVFGFPVSGLDTFKLIQINVSGPELVTGGAFGPEAGLVLLVGLALGFLLIFIYAKN